MNSTLLTDLESMEKIKDFLDSLLIVIVVYRRSLLQSPTWSSLSEELMYLPGGVTLLIHDNSPESQPLPLPQFMECHYRHDNTNPGVSAAYNNAHLLATRLGKEWLLLFDQDTFLSKGALIGYGEAVAANPSHVLFAPTLRDPQGIVSPFAFRRGGGARLFRPLLGPLPIRKYKVMNSGLLIRNDSFQRVGGFDPALPLDFSDIAFLEKMRMITTDVFITASTFDHEFSGSRTLGLSESLARYKRFSEGAHSMSCLYGNSFWLFARSLFRGIKLAIEHNSLRFIPLHFRSWNR